MSVYPSAQKLYDVIIGALPETNPWWVQWDDPYAGVVDPEAVPDDWKITGFVWNPNESEEGGRTLPFQLNYPALLGALEIIAEREPFNEDVMEPIHATLENEEDPDFDSESADVVCQMAVFGTTHFG